MNQNKILQQIGRILNRAEQDLSPTGYVALLYKLLKLTMGKIIKKEQ